MSALTFNLRCAESYRTRLQHVTHFQMLRQERIFGVLVHAPLIGDLRTLPLDAVRVIYDDVLPFRDVHCPGWISRNVDFHYSIAVVHDFKVYVGEQVKLEVRFLPRPHKLLQFSNESPNWKVIVKHLQIESMHTVTIQIVTANGPASHAVADICTACGIHDGKELSHTTPGNSNPS